MDKRELEMYRIQEIIEDLIANKPIKQIARMRKISKNTVKSYRLKLQSIISENNLSGNEYDQVMKHFSILRKHERYSKNFGWLLHNQEYILMLQSKCENIVLLYEKLQEKGFTGSYSSFLRYINKNNKHKDEPVIRIETKAGEVAQVDFGYAGYIYDPVQVKKIKAYVFVMVLGFSRDAYYEIVKSQDVTTWCLCHIHAFEHFGGTPEVVIPDNLKSGIVKASFFDPIANKTYAECAKYYGFQIDPCIPATPEHKGKVESGVKYVKNNFLPLREFKDFEDANNQLYEWNKNKASQRIHGTTRRKPAELFEQYESEALGKLPKERFEIPVWKNLKVYRDIHIQFDNSYYSVPYEYRGEYVWARKTCTQVAIFHELKSIAVHLPANPGKRMTNDDHYPPDKIRYMRYDTDYCLKKSRLIGENVVLVIERLLKEEPIRNLRSAQNIIRLSEKYGHDRLDNSCRRAIRFGNPTYYLIKSILEKKTENDPDLFDNNDRVDKLDSTYARDLDEILSEGANNGNAVAN
jgi:transposase